MFKNTIRLFWWNEKLFHGKTKENYGDLLGAYLVEKIAQKKVVFAHPKKFSVYDFFLPIYVTIGSILTNVNHKCIVWGSGIINTKFPIKRAKFLAVRGPQTRNYLLGFGYEVPEVYGDPALLLPNYFLPKVEKKYTFGIVPHYVDWDLVKDQFANRNDIHVIDMMTNDIESKTIEFLQCERIISSSLHGVIIAHAYGIPAVWQKFSDKVFGDDVKYRDYMESLDIPFYSPEIKSDNFTNEQLDELFQKYPNLPKFEKVEQVRNDLLKACPFLD